ncbi:MAG: SIS domain-containing protein [Lachnospiraceae bacterium]|nr:SIS domain-containing protein [Lachnospiraceae bacterium]
MITSETYTEAKNTVLGECQAALGAIDTEAVNEYLDMILKADKVFFVGVGRVLLELECIAKRFAHLGIQTVVVGQITEPAITPSDVLVVGSGSGETLFPAGIARKAKAIGAKVIHIGSNPESGLKTVADLFVRIPVESRAKASDEIHSEQPMTSLFEQSLLLFGDTTAMMLVKDRGIVLDDLWQYHANLE